MRPYMKSNVAGGIYSNYIQPLDILSIYRSLVILSTILPRELGLNLQREWLPELA